MKNNLALVKMRVTGLLFCLLLMTLLWGIVEAIEAKEAILTASPSSAKPGDEIILTFQGAPGSLQDWATLVPVEAANELYGEWYFLGGEREGKLWFRAPEKEGNYEFRLFADWPAGGYEVLATSNVVRVGGTAPVYGGDEVILLDDDFDSEHGGEGQLNYYQFANWDVTKGSIDLIGYGFWDFFPDHGLHLDLDGSTGEAGRLESRTSFRFESGEYRLEFDLAGSPMSGPNTVTVSLGRAYSEDFTLAVKEPFRTIVRTIPVRNSTSTRLIFEHAGADNQGLLLDNVKLTKVSGEILEEEEGVLDLSVASEEWAREWTVLNTITDFPGGGKAGFYEEAIRSGHANPNPGREGILYLHPLSQKEPARLSRRITLTGPSPTLRIGVSGNREVDGDWTLLVKVDGEPLEEQKVIAGAEGWQDLTFDLSAYSGETLDIEVEAWANDWYYEYAFLDYIQIGEEGVGALPPQGLIAYWKFDEGSGTLVDDSSGNGNDGTVRGANWTTGRLGNALAFDGKDDWVDIPGLLFDGDFTIEVWVKLTGTISNADAIVGQEGAGQDINFHGARLRLYAPGNKIVAKTATAAELWTHYAITRSEDRLTLYHNGIQDATGTWTGDFVPEAIGRGNAGYLSGVIDEVRLYDRALSPSEIEADMDATQPVVPPPPTQVLHKDAFRLSTGELIIGELLSFDGNTFKIRTEKGVIEKTREEIMTISVGISQ